MGEYQPMKRSASIATNSVELILLINNADGNQPEGEHAEPDGNEGIVIDRDVSDADITGPSRTRQGKHDGHRLEQHRADIPAR